MRMLIVQTLFQKNLKPRSFKRFITSAVYLDSKVPADG